MGPDVNIGSHGDDDDAARTRNCLISNPNQNGLRTNCFWFVFIETTSALQCWTKGRRSTAVAEDLRPTATVAKV